LKLSPEDLEDRLRRALDQRARELRVDEPTWRGPSKARRRSTRRSPVRWLPAGAAAISLATVVAIAVAAGALVVAGHHHPSAADSNGQAVPGSTGTCRSELRDGVLPGWARSGFSDPEPRTTYVLGTSGRIVAILFGSRSLSSPPAADHHNKILWVSRVATTGHDLRIEAQRMSGSRPLGAPVARSVTGGPGPSIINLPSPGCWRFSLRWSGRTDTLDLQYGPHS
jgi:hypothetical protein